VVKEELLSSYYKKTKPFYHRFFKEIFGQGKSFDEISSLVTKKSIFKDFELDSVSLYESVVFLKRSIYNLLGYKYLVCGNHLPMSKVSLYYSYFDSINCLLRIRCFAIVHFSEVPETFEQNPRKLIFTIIQHQDHSYSLDNSRRNEHQLVWTVFHDYFPMLSSNYDGRWFTQDRYEWNYGLLYLSQATDTFAEREIQERCNHNFLNPNFLASSSEDESQYKHDLLGNHGFEEIHAGDLIKECIRLLVLIADKSEYRDDYVKMFSDMKDGVNFFESKEDTKSEILKWIDNAMDELSGPDES